MGLCDRLLRIMYSDKSPWKETAIWYVVTVGEMFR